MINKDKNKRVQLTLPHETAELLKSLSIRYNKSSSEIVKWALNVLASKKQHVLKIKYEETSEKTDNNELKSTIKKIVRLQNDNEPEQEQPVDWDELLDDIETANQNH